MLTTGGHNAGIVSEPGHPRRSYRVLECSHGGTAPDPEEWMKDAPAMPGSWWPAWIEWLASRSGGEAAPAPMGRGPYHPIYSAPGTYVHQR